MSNWRGIIHRRFSTLTEEKFIAKSGSVEAQVAVLPLFGRNLSIDQGPLGFQFFKEAAFALQANPVIDKVDPLLITTRNQHSDSLQL
jgi:hypothetical protein